MRQLLDDYGDIRRQISEVEKKNTQEAGGSSQGGDRSDTSSGKRTARHQRAQERGTGRRERKETPTTAGGREAVGGVTFVESYLSSEGDEAEATGGGGMMVQSYFDLPGEGAGEGGPRRRNPTNDDEDSRCSARDTTFVLSYMSSSDDDDRDTTSQRPGDAATGGVSGPANDTTFVQSYLRSSDDEDGDTTSEGRGNAATGGGSDHAGDDMYLRSHLDLQDENDRVTPRRSKPTTGNSSAATSEGIFAFSYLDSSDDESQSLPAPRQGETRTRGVPSVPSTFAGDATLVTGKDDDEKETRATKRARTTRASASSAHSANEGQAKRGRRRAPRSSAQTSNTNGTTKPKDLKRPRRVVGSSRARKSSRKGSKEAQRKRNLATVDRIEASLENLGDFVDRYEHKWDLPDPERTPPNRPLRPSAKNTLQNIPAHPPLDVQTRHAGDSFFTAISGLLICLKAKLGPAIDTNRLTPRARAYFEHIGKLRANMANQDPNDVKINMLVSVQS